MPALRPILVWAAWAACAALALSLGAAPAAFAAEPDPTPAEPNVRVTLPWLATQLIPSPELATGDSRAHFGLRWQLTPLLFSWGIHRGLSPWRTFVAEPYVRQSGSIELFFSPEFFASGPLGEGLGLRTGVRSYFPLVEHGEYLSVSLGSSHLLYAGRSFAAGEVGAYVLFGVLGMQLTLSPRAGPLSAIATFRVRYF